MEYSALSNARRKKPFNLTLIASAMITASLALSGCVNDNKGSSGTGTTNSDNTSQTENTGTNTTGEQSPKTDNTNNDTTQGNTSGNNSGNDSTNTNTTDNAENTNTSSAGTPEKKALSFNVTDLTGADLFKKLAGTYTMRLTNIDNTAFPNLALDEEVKLTVTADGALNLTKADNTPIINSDAFASYSEFLPNGSTSGKFVPSIGKTLPILRKQKGTTTKYWSLQTAMNKKANASGLTLSATFQENGIIVFTQTDSTREPFKTKLQAKNAGLVKDTFYAGNLKGLPALDRMVGSYTGYIDNSTIDNVNIGKFDFKIERVGNQGRITGGVVDITSSESPEELKQLGKSFFGQAQPTGIITQIMRFSNDDTNGPTFEMSLTDNVHFHDAFKGSYKIDGKEFTFTSKPVSAKAPDIFTKLKGNYKLKQVLKNGRPINGDANSVLSISESGKLEYALTGSCKTETIAWDGVNDDKTLNRITLKPADNSTEVALQTTSPDVKLSQLIVGFNGYQVTAFTPGAPNALDTSEVFKNCS